MLGTNTRDKPFTNPHGRNEEWFKSLQYQPIDDFAHISDLPVYYVKFNDFNHFVTKQLILSLPPAQSYGYDGWYRKHNWFSIAPLANALVEFNRSSPMYQIPLPYIAELDDFALGYGDADQLFYFRIEMRGSRAYEKLEYALDDMIKVMCRDALNRNIILWDYNGKYKEEEEKN